MLISQDQKRNQQVPHLAFRRGPKVARAGLQCPVAGAAHPNPHLSGQWEGHWAPSHWAPNGYYGLWGPPGAWGGPYTVWGGPYVPYRYYGDWGALWYPYAEWRGPHGGWGNP